ncbi:hypothetical protein [Streptacidiphilus sp. EB129]|jgi:hypothetical protein|uniref:hypothetical protein n=1 Tax=Streptacidiphilus sp. EB129 TaxID=3156262 RepID=UPI003513972F
MTMWVNPKYAKVVEELRAARQPNAEKQTAGVPPKVRGFLMSGPVAERPDGRR